jgi:hypothetical protein
MAEAKTEEKTSRFSALFKAITSSVVGLLSGAVLMYVSPLVNSAIKPPRPVPNFAFAAEGSQGTFTNRSTGGTQGWWDFGDGSELVPFAANQANVVHKFPGPGNYPVKLSLSNLIGEDVDRTVNVRIDTGGGPMPVIQSLAALGKKTSVPATFQLQAVVQNADTVIWCIDDEQVHIDDVPAGGQIVRPVTFTYYGPKKIRLVALNGKSHVEQSTDVWIDVPDETPTMVVALTGITPRLRMIPFSISIPATHQGETYPFEITRSVWGDDEIIEGHIAERPSEQLVRNPQLLFSPDRRSFQIKGELLRGGAAKGKVSPSWFGKVELKVKGRSTTATPIGDPVSVALKLPGTTTLDLPTAPPGTPVGVQWELRQGMDVVMKDTKAPIASVVRLGNQTYRVTVQQAGRQIVVTTQPAAGSPAPIVSTSGVRKN